MGGLYSKNYSSFEEYCQTRWGWTRRNADQYIEAASYVESEKSSSQISSINQALTEIRAEEMAVRCSSEAPHLGARAQKSAFHFGP